MKYTALLPLAILFSCSKNRSEVASVSKQAEVQKVNCSFGLPQLNTTQRPVANVAATKKANMHPQPAPATPPNATIFLDFDGHYLSGTYWNTKGDIQATPANLVPVEIEKIKHRVAEDFAPFDVTITTDEAVFNQTDAYKRMRVVVTENWQWYGMAGGVAFPNSFQWGNNTPCFVFSTLLSYNEKWIAEAISHEVGHTLGLAHQASFSSNCSLLTEFNSGAGTGTYGWAPIMGSSYQQNVTTWHKGQTTNGCNVVQDEVATLASILGLKTDEADASHKDEVTDVVQGVINSSTDVDRFYIELKKPSSIAAIPSCLDNCEGGNLNLQLKVYRKNGQLVTATSDPTSLAVSTKLPAGKYMVDVETKATPYQDRYGMLGMYHVRVQP